MGSPTSQTQQREAPGEWVREPLIEQRFPEPKVGKRKNWITRADSGLSNFPGPSSVGLTRSDEMVLTLVITIPTLEASRLFCGGLVFSDGFCPYGRIQS